MNAPTRYYTPRAAWLLLGAALVVLFLPDGWAWAGGLLAAVGFVGIVHLDRSHAVEVDYLEWVRDTPPRWSVGQPNRVGVTISNDEEIPARVTVRETPPSGFAGERRTPRPVSIPAYGHQRLEFEFTPSERGCYEFGEVGVRSVGPLGLGGWQGTLPTRQEARVYPDIKAVRSYALLQRRGALREVGVRTARYPGVGTEFESLREYQAGRRVSRDRLEGHRPPRRADRAFLRGRAQPDDRPRGGRGRLMTPMVGEQSRLDRAVNAALLLAWLATRGDDLVGLLVFGRDVQR